MPKLPHNRTWYAKKLVDLAKKCAKKRDDYVCQMCGKDCVGSDAHGSHVLNVGSYKFMELDPTNIKCLCSYCHLRIWHKDIIRAYEWFKDKFPQRYDYLMLMKKMSIKITTVEMAELWEACLLAGANKDPLIYGKKYVELIENKTKELG